VLEWRLDVHWHHLLGPTGAARLAAFDETFLMLAGICALAVLAAWQLEGGPQGASPRQ
jgi:hypothetical protein